MDRPTGTTPVLPTLQDKCYFLETASRPTGPLQSLVLDHLLMNEGEAIWLIRTESNR